MSQQFRTLLLASLITFPAVAQDSDRVRLEAEAARAGWTLSLSPTPGNGQVAHDLLFRKDDMVLTARALTQATIGGPLILRDVHFTEDRQGMGSGAISASRIVLSDLGALALVDETQSLPDLLCTATAVRPLTFDATNLTFVADPDGMARAQRVPETLTISEFSLSAMRNGPHDLCRIDLHAAARGIDLRAADGTQALIERATFSGTSESDELNFTSLDLRIEDATALTGAHMLVAFSELAASASGDFQAVRTGIDGNLTSNLASTQVAIQVELRGLELPLRNLLPSDIDLPEQILRGTPEQKITGDILGNITLASGDASARMGINLAGFTDFELQISGQLPEQSGGVEIIPGVPPEITGMSLHSANMFWRDRGANAIVTHYSGTGIPAHMDTLLRPAARFLPAAVLAQLRDATASWLATGLSTGASLSLAPQNPVALAQVGTLLLFTPQAVPEFLGLSLER